MEGGIGQRYRRQQLHPFRLTWASRRGGPQQAKQPCRRQEGSNRQPPPRAHLAITSGRSRKKVMPRKPSASHCRGERDAAWVGKSGPMHGKQSCTRAAPAPLQGPPAAADSRAPAAARRWPHPQPSSAAHLGAEVAAALVQPLQARVLLRVHVGVNLQAELACGRRDRAGQGRRQGAPKAYKRVWLHEQRSPYPQFSGNKVCAAAAKRGGGATPGHTRKAAHPRAGSSG